MLRLFFICPASLLHFVPQEGGDGASSVNNSSCGLVVNIMYRIGTVSTWHIFHIREIRLPILYKLPGTYVM